MNKVATLGLALLLVFSGCLGFGEDDTPEQEEKDTVEPVGETDLEGLENDINLLTSRLDAEEAKLALLEDRVNGWTDAPDALEALGCRENEIARYTSDEWVCSDSLQDVDTSGWDKNVDDDLDGTGVWSIVSDDFDNINSELEYAWYFLNSLQNDTVELQEDVWDTNDEMENTWISCTNLRFISHIQFKQYTHFCMYMSSNY